MLMKLIALSHYNNDTDTRFRVDKKEYVVRKRVVSLLILIPLIMLSLAGCSSESGDYSTVRKISFDYTDGWTSLVRRVIISSDYTVRYFENFHFDELNDEWQLMDEWELSETEWNSLIDVLKENDFCGLPETITPKRTVYDAPTYDIEVETDDSVHRISGIGSGAEKNRIYKRFNNIVTALFNCVEID